MSRATPDDQLKFLLSCVKHSNNGKIDFVEVAQECGVVSKGAAAKRYERLMKANGINPNGGPDPKPRRITTPKEPKSNPKDDSPKPPAKRRRTNKTVEKKQEEVAASPARLKVEVLESVKTEARGLPVAGDLPIPSNQNIQHEPTQSYESSFDFNDFCSPEMFANCGPDPKQPSQEDASPQAGVSEAESAAFSNGQVMPQPARGELETDKKPERETVIIAD